MKKIIFSLLLLFALGSATKITAQQPHRVKYYYYPSSNIYYSSSTGDYWYYDDTNSDWVTVKTLPTTIMVRRSPRYTVYYNGSDVWKGNNVHRKKYKVKHNGVVKAKPKNS